MRQQSLLQSFSAARRPCNTGTVFASVSLEAKQVDHAVNQELLASESQQSCKSENDSRPQEEQDLHDPSEGGLDDGSDLEREREAIIARNRAMLCQLNIKEAASDLRPTRPVAASKPRRVRTPPPPREPRTQREAAVRARALITGKPAPERETSAVKRLRVDEECDSIPAGNFEPDMLPVQQSLETCDSHVRRYWCSEVSSGTTALDFTPLSSEEQLRLQGFTTSEDLHLTARASRVYHIAAVEQSGKAMLVAGGHEGWVSIFGLPGLENATHPLWSFKGHAGWVGSLHWGSSGDIGVPILFSCGNDGFVRLWDTARATDGVPAKLLEAKNLHGKANLGLFSMDVAGNDVVTAARDGSVCVSVLDAHQLRTVQLLTPHTGLCKAVALQQDRPVVASAGADRTVALSDFRSAPLRPALVFTDAHGGAVNSVSWQPTKTETFMTCGWDHTIKLWDCRAATAGDAKPLQVFIGHTPAAARQCGHGAIRHPIFYGAAGDYIVASGERSLSLTLFRASDGSIVSNGNLSCSPTSFCTLGRQLFFANASSVKPASPWLSAPEEKEPSSSRL